MPRQSQGRTEKVEIRATPDEKEAWQTEAALAHQDLSVWARAALHWYAAECQAKRAEQEQRLRTKTK